MLLLPRPLFACLCLLAAGLFALPAHSQGQRADALFAAPVQTLNGQATDLSRYRGQALVVNFWARWCAPCREEIPELREFREQHQGKIEVIGIGVEPASPALTTFARDYRINYPVFVAGDAGLALMRQLGNPPAALPFTLFINRQGEIVQAKLGRLQRRDLDAAKELILKK